MSIIFPEQAAIENNEHVPGICYFICIEYFEHPLNEKMKLEDMVFESDPIAGFNDALEAMSDVTEQLMMKFPDASLMEIDIAENDEDDEDVQLFLVDEKEDPIATIGLVVEDYRNETIH
jgi:hypothetical protein